MWEFGNQKSNVTDDKYKKERDDLFAQMEEKKNEIFALVDSYGDTDTTGNIKDLISDGIQIYVGGHVVKFEISDVEELPADKLKQDIKQQFQKKLEEIKNSINDKLYSLSESYESLREKLEDEIEKYKSENVKVEMPEITYDHAKRGLSVVKGNNQNELIWLFRGKYMVNTVDSQHIEHELIKRTVKDVIVEIRTHDRNVVKVKLKKLHQLDDFIHYHSTDEGASDCWGDWKYHQKWDTPDDIIDIGVRALNILKDVNTDSPGDEDPPGLPSISQLLASMTKRQMSDDESEDNNDEVSENNEGSSNLWTV